MISKRSNTTNIGRLRACQNKLSKRSVKNGGLQNKKLYNKHQAMTLDTQITNAIGFVKIPHATKFDPKIDSRNFVTNKILTKIYSKVLCKSWKQKATMLCTNLETYKDRHV
jgi:hypothetical protein